MTLIKSIGPIVCVAVALWGYVAIRASFNVMFPHDCFEGNISSVVKEFRSVSKLKVLRVIDADKDTYPGEQDDAYKDGHVDYQYSGTVDLYVDLSKMSVAHSPSNTLIVTLEGIDRGDVRELSLSRNLSADDVEYGIYRRFYGSKSVQDDLHSRFSQIQADSVVKGACSEENIARAKMQAEKLLRQMFKPFVDDPNHAIEFKWMSGVVKK